MPYGILDGGVIIAEFVVPMTLRNNKPVFVTDSLSLKRSTRKRSAQRWELETKLEPKERGAQDLMVNLVVNGYDGLVTIITPQNTGVVKARTSVSTPSASGLAGASQVTVTNNVGLIPKGSFIRFANHSKVYMLTSNLSGNGPMGIFPTLRMDVSASTFNFRDDVVMNCFWDTDTVLGMTYEDGILMDMGTVKLIERI